MKIILIILLVVAIVKWITWRITTLALIYYNEKNKFPHPTKDEMRECIAFVVKNTVKDVTGRKGNKEKVR